MSTQKAAYCINQERTWICTGAASQSQTYGQKTQYTERMHLDKERGNDGILLFFLFGNYISITQSVQ